MYRESHGPEGQRWRLERDGVRVARLGHMELATGWEYTLRAGAAHGGCGRKERTRSSLCFRKNSHAKAECWRENSGVPWIALRELEGMASAVGLVWRGERGGRGQPPQGLVTHGTVWEVRQREGPPTPSPRRESRRSRGGAKRMG